MVLTCICDQSKEFRNVLRLEKCSHIKKPTCFFLCPPPPPTTHPQAHVMQRFYVKEPGALTVHLHTVCAVTLDTGPQPLLLQPAHLLSNGPAEGLTPSSRLPEP